MTSNTRVGVPVTAVWEDPSVVREIDSAATLRVPDIAGWRTAIDGEAHLGLLKRVVSQALLGEPVTVIDERDGWSEVRLPEQPSSLDPAGYPGWIRTDHLVPLAGSSETSEGPRAADRTTIVGALTVTARRHSGEPLELSLGTTLPLVGDMGEGILTVRHPDGSELRVPADAIRLPNGSEGPVLALARMFLDKPYFWAGLSGHGVDCSGLVHLVYRCLGIRVPRDADDQAVSAEPIEVGAARPGDPVFFENATGIHHVGLALGAGRMIHSPRCDRLVSLDRIADGYDGERVTAGRLS